jgi:hypothetical protein
MMKDRGILVSHRSASKGAEGQSELLGELVRSVVWIFRSCPDEMREAAAHDEMLQLKPHVKEAIDVLGDIEKQRHLTEEEMTLRRAFRLLLVA